MRTMHKLMLPLAAVVLIAAGMSGCQSKNTASVDDRSTFKGGPMPANVGNIIAERTKASEDRASHASPAAH